MIRNTMSLIFIVTWAAPSLQVDESVYVWWIPWGTELYPLQNRNLSAASIFWRIVWLIKLATLSVGSDRKDQSPQAQNMKLAM